jgi:hypothetical protein
MLIEILTALKCDIGDFGGILAGLGYVIRCPRSFGVFIDYEGFSRGF